MLSCHDAFVSPAPATQATRAKIGEFPCKQIKPARHLKSTTVPQETRTAKERERNLLPSKTTPLLPRFYADGTNPEQSRTRSPAAPPRPGRACTTRESTAAGGLSSKPVRRRSPTLGRFDSCAAPLAGKPHHLQELASVNLRIQALFARQRPPETASYRWWLAPNWRTCGQWPRSCRRPPRMETSRRCASISSSRITGA